MKKLIWLLMAACMGMGAQAQDHWKNGFTVGASAEFTLQNDKAVYDFRNFWGTTINVGYKHYLVSGVFIHPSFSVYCEHHDTGYLVYFPDGPSTNYINDSHATETGIGISLVGGFTIPIAKFVGLDIQTGPYYSFGLDQHSTYQWTTGSKFHSINDYRKSSLRWKFGGGLNVWRFKLTATYDVSTLKVCDGGEREGNVVSLGLSYKF